MKTAQRPDAPGNLNVKKFHTPEGLEIPDQRPLAVDAALNAPDTLQDQVRRLMAQEFAFVAARAGAHAVETPDEADDFSIPDDDGDLLSQYQVQLMAPEPDPEGVTNNPPPLPAAEVVQAPATPAPTAGGPVQ